MDLLKVINNISDVIIKNKDYLTELDREIGDGDHGVNLARGFEKIKEQLPTFKDLKLNELFNKLAMTLMSNVGGASGALYSSALLKASMYLKQIDNKVDAKQIVNVFDQMILAIKSRGNSTVGEKTMLDTLVPAYEALNEGTNKNLSLNDLWSNVLNKAKTGMEKTKDIIATKGRASYLKERSIGHLDPGAVSSYLIIETIYKTIKGEL